VTTTEETRRERKARTDAETLRLLRHLLHNQPLWATLIEIRKVASVLDRVTDSC
jgi:hypothetical protein